MIRCKMVVSSITKRSGWGELGNGQHGPRPVADITFSVVSSGSEENKKFFLSTPSGTFNFTTVNPEVINRLEMDLGKEVYVDISLVPPVPVVPATA